MEAIDLNIMAKIMEKRFKKLSDKVLNDYYNPKDIKDNKKFKGMF